MPSARDRIVGLSVVSAAVAVCIPLVDRRLALWVSARFYGTTAFAIGASTASEFAADLNVRPRWSC